MPLGHSYCAAQTREVGLLESERPPPLTPSLVPSSPALPTPVSTSPPPAARARNQSRCAERLLAGLLVRETDHPRHLGKRGPPALMEAWSAPLTLAHPEPLSWGRQQSYRLFPGGPARSRSCSQEPWAPQEGGLGGARSATPCWTASRRQLLIGAGGDLRQPRRPDVLPSLLISPVRTESGKGLTCLI